MTLLEKLESRSATLGVVGLGYVGLSLSMEFLRAGYRVVGIDIDVSKVEKVNAGLSYVMDVSSEELAAIVDDAVAKTGASSVKDMGKVMGMSKKAVQQSGKDADNRELSELIKKRLS